jgi:hypothetical protein
VFSLKTLTAVLGVIFGSRPDKLVGKDILVFLFVEVVATPVALNPVFFIATFAPKFVVSASDKVVGAELVSAFTALVAPTLVGNFVATLANLLLFFFVALRGGFYLFTPNTFFKG